MKTIIYAFVAVALAACNNQNQSNQVNSASHTSVAAADNVNAPVFKFEKDSYDFGEITEGEKVSYDFRFTNTGKTPLVISNATATCGCTVPDYPRDPVLPGQEAVISVVFNSAGKAGMQNKVVTLTSNAVPSQTELHLIGNVNSAKP